MKKISLTFTSLIIIALIPLFNLNVKTSQNLNINSNINTNLQNMQTFKNNNILASDLTFVYNDKTFNYNRVSSNNFYISYINQIKEQEVRSKGIRNVYLEQISNGKNTIDALDYMFGGFKAFYTNMASQIEAEYKPNKMIFNPNSSQMFSLNAGQDGIKINEQNLALDILSGKSKIEVKTTVQTSPFSPAELEDNTHLRASAQTSIASSESGRRFNVIKALACFNGLSVSPGEVCSFNATLDNRHNGIPYREATVIINGKFTKGIGGGICQASTTLFNALILSGLEIVEAHTHSLPVGYVERGFDATVNDSTLDLKFRNSTPYPIYIKSGVRGTNVFAEVYGQDMDGVFYEKQSEVEKIEPPKPKVIDDINDEYNLQEGEFYTQLYAQYGYKVKAYLVKNQNGQKQKTLLRTATYAPTQSIIYKGVTKRQNETFDADNTQKQNTNTNT